ncbi:uncharacterized protein LOC131309659 [Rhododendron vialii]|uniref:uncharacterized protein LOC131309659 n=1 Tax=Rhododendron vialii TaxID=182163 RepID=UPI002660336A|nr:uncharacterized protein LOC131309659 [Rhododendron vialii]
MVEIQGTFCICSMARFICKGLLPTRPVASTRAYGLSFSTSSLKPTLDCSISTCPQSPTVSYLVNSCGLSLESAISASKNLQFVTTDQPNSVLTVLESIGLGKSHIRNLIIKRPLILLADANKTLKPNVEVFGSLGISGTDLRKLLIKDPRFFEVDAHSTVEFFSAYGFTKEQICMLTMKHPQLYWYNAPRNFKPKMEYFKSLGFSDAEIVQSLLYVPYVLGRSLENTIIPSVQFIKRIVGTDENVLKAIKASYRLFDLGKVREPNIAILINHGVPKPLVLKFITSRSRSLVLNTHQFTKVVEEADKLGFDPTSMLYLLAVNSLATINKSLWERKSGVYCSFGMSEDQILSAFIRQPMFMLTSEKKIRKLMGFFVNELKIIPSVISKSPKLMLLSLEKRLVPRCSVLQLLMSKGAIIKGDFSLVHALEMTHKKFEERYVSEYQNVIPEVVEARQGKIPFQGFPI